MKNVSYKKLIFKNILLKYKVKYDLENIDVRIISEENMNASNFNLLGVPPLINNYEIIVQFIENNSNVK